MTLIVVNKQISSTEIEYFRFEKLWCMDIGYMLCACAFARIPITNYVTGQLGACTCLEWKKWKLPRWRQEKQIERTRGLRCYFAPTSAVLSGWNLATGEYECKLSGVWWALIRNPARFFVFFFLSYHNTGGALGGAARWIAMWKTPSMPTCTLKSFLVFRKCQVRPSHGFIKWKS